MTKQITIKEDGVSKSESVDFINTQVAGGSADWMPEDEAQEGVFYVYENGEYVPSEYGLYGFYAVGVLVPGGNGAETIQQGSSTPAYVTPLPATGLGASVIGVDPIDGAMYRTEIQDVDGVPTLVKTKVADSKAEYKPTSMKILIKPAKLSYNAGEKINYAGLVVQLLDSTGYTFVDERFPQGVISWSPVRNLLYPEYDLITPVEYAQKDLTSIKFNTLDHFTYPERYTLPISYSYTSKCVYKLYVNTLVDGFDVSGYITITYTFDNDVYVASFINRKIASNGHIHDVLQLACATQYWGQGLSTIKRTTEVEYEHEGSLGLDYWNSTESSVEYDGKRVYALYAYTAESNGSSVNHIETRIVESSTPLNNFLGRSPSGFYRLEHGAIGWNMINSKIKPSAEIPVQWNSPYDNQTYEDTFEIEVEDA